MSFINLIANVFSWLLNIWGQLPESAKKSIIDTIVNAAEATFRSFFRSYTSK